MVMDQRLKMESSIQIITFFTGMGDVCAGIGSLFDCCFGGYFDGNFGGYFGTYFPVLLSSLVGGGIVSWLI